ncbi:alpha-L-rhamnosidase [Evansella caseinilytica]|uniref:alpha-L-rhamnosidase n=1 Tax=Evansella caseinilytica TaxID=1503961 RepID=A0A1H3U4M3_9BACI|nr:family 78 glycoside hydrolase catalytic domain [Evansella caseinilytica]SDZ57237.1 alpha-L-rhamnosidase [Evansella caseinilytica]
MLKIASIKIDGLPQECITDRRPNISFALASDQSGEALQRAVITVGDWKLETTDQLNNLYGGEMKSFTTYQVHVAAFGTSGERAEATAFFQTGRLDTPWTGKWITDRHYDFPEKVSPVPMTFRRSFTVSKKLQRAWVNVSALGVYELLLNGTKVGQDYFAPGLTSYEHQIQYQTYEVTDQLTDCNTFTAVVAGGWAAGSFNYKRKNKISADRQAFLCELHLAYTDGSSEIVATDPSWQVTEEGNYRMAEWYDGETYDATIDLNQVTWKQASVTEPRKQPKLLAQYGAPVRVQEVRKPVSRSAAPSGEIVYDFGQNFAGVILAKIRGEKGRQVIFRHAEVLVDGELFVKSLRTAKATATYICTAGEQTYSPRLTYMGFRYVGVRGIDPDKMELSALVLHSDMEEVGGFECSNQMINQLQSNIRWGARSNFVDIPTDCPQRDERQGWTGDIAVFASTACYNFDMSRFLDKWLMDMRSEQSAGGGIPMVVPRAGDTWPVMATSCWGDSCILVPWAEYLARGEKQLLERQYPTMKKFLKAAKWWSSFLSLTPNSRYVWRFPFHFGDWCAPDETARQWIGKGKWIGTAYFANSCSIVAQIADLLGYQEDAASYRALRQRIMKAYRHVFTDGNGTLKKEFQTGYVLPLHFEMTEGQETKTMAENLVKLIRDAGNHLATGFTGTPYLLFALSDNGYTDVAYELLLQEKCPSWLYQVKAGGTTIWERWDALRPDGTVNIGELTGKKNEEESEGGMVSFNHYANGAVGDWLYKRMAGIEATSGGYKTFKVAPVIGGGITYAKGSVKTPYGTAAASWKIEHGIFTIQVDVPVSTECTLILPDQTKHLLTSGTHTFSHEWEKET